MTTTAKWTDQKVEGIIGSLLRIGVLLSATVVLIGATIFLGRHGGAAADFRVFKGEPTDLRSVHGIVQRAAHLSGRGIIQLGLLLLIATPVARVAFAIYGFAAEGDRMYVVFTAIVLAVLLYSLAGGA
jgi:uncharacterized membrane protein